MAGNPKPTASRAGRDGAQVPRRRATTIATEGRLVLAEGYANSRLFAYLAGNYVHRVDRERRELHHGDPDLALVAEIIGTTGVEPGMRDAAFRQKYSRSTVSWVSRASAP